jgi:hypothetical protein
VSLQPGASKSLTPLARGGLASLPLAAQGPISELLGRGAPTYAVHGLQAVNPAQRFGLEFSRTGVTVASGAARLRIALSAYGYAGSLRAVSAVAPRARANRVNYTRGQLTQWYANGPAGLEQGFDVAAPPAAGSGPLVLSLSLSGGLSAHMSDGGVLLEGHGARLRYGDLVVTDAHGRTLRSSLALRGGRLEILTDDRGAAYPLRIDPLVQEAELTDADEPSGDNYTVATSGTTIAVGEPGWQGKEGHEYFEGAVYIFQEPETGWANATETAKLTSPGKAATELEQFGHSVAISGDTLVVGAPDYAGTGAAFVYEPTAEQWADPKAVATLTASDGRDVDSFGWSVAIDGKTIAVGAPDHYPPGPVLTLAGTAYVFVEPGGGWKSTSGYSAELNASGDETACGELGGSIATTETTVVVGAPAFLESLEAKGSACEKNELSGKAYVFVRGASWPGPASSPLGPTVSLTPAGREVGDRFGYSASIATSGDTILVGSPGQKVGEAKHVGAAYLFYKPEAGWTGTPAQARLDTPLPTKGVEFGASVSLSSSGGTAVVAQPDDSEPSFESRSAGFVFAVPSSGGAPTLTGELIASENQIREVAVSGATVVGSGFGASFVFAPLAISVNSPANGATYTQGQTVKAEYECNAPPGGTVEKCTGTVPNGAPIETSTLGIHEFLVEAQDSEGGQASSAVFYKVAAATSSEGSKTEATSTTATTIPPELTPEQKAAAAAAAKAQREKEDREFDAWILAVMNNPENETIGAKLLNEGGIPVSYKLVPEPGLIATTGSTVTWYKPKGEAARAVAASTRKPKPIVVFKLSYSITKAGKVSFKVPLTSAGRKLLKQDIKAHRSLVVYWTVTFTPQANRPVTRTFKVTLKPARRKNRR